MTATGFGISEILAGAPVTVSSTIIIIDAASPATTGARRTLTHPDSANFPIVTYNCNPARTLNFDLDPIFVPAADTTRTLGTTLATITDSAIDDVIVTEVWEGGGGRASMPTAFYRRLRELLINRPTVGTFIQWAPADRTVEVFNVQLLGLRVGTARGVFDVNDVGADLLVGLDAVPTGVLDRAVALDLLIDSQV